MTLVPPIKRVQIEEGALDCPQTLDIVKRLTGLPIERVQPNGIKARPTYLDMDKETLRLLPFQGQFLKPCPGTKAYICCGYQILQVGTNCPLDCTYCILQAYFNQPSLRVFSNLESQLAAVGEFIERNPGQIFRIGTGEFTDSLALEHVSHFSHILLPFFSDKKNAILELKTKTDRIDNLIASNYRDRIIVSWSLNSPSVAFREEQGAPSIRKRLVAASRCQAEGFTVGFHFDPLIEHPNWEKEYLKTLELIDSYVDPKGIIWVSLGCLRYLPVLKRIIRKRHPATHILDSEFVPGLDGKMRYFKPLRIHMYAYMREILERWHQDLGIYLCMESDEVWEKAMGWSPGTTKGLSNYLDSRVMEISP